MSGNGRIIYIAGAGIAGLTLALALGKFGARVVVLERQPSVQEFGAGLQISANARKVLDRLAFEAHRDQLDSTGCANIARDRLVGELLNAAGDPDAKPARLADYLSHRAGLLNEQDDGVFQFPHRSFQEYLAACHLTNDDYPNQLADLARDDPQRWREVLRLAAAKAGRGSAASVWLLAETLCPAPVEGDPQDTALTLREIDAWGALLAGQVLAENADLDQIAPRDAVKHARIRDWQLALLRRKALPSFERALAGRSLAALGDPRPEVATLDGMQFCYVPAGPFWMGDDQDGHAKPMHSFDLPAFWIGRYPVTTAQWREYMAESGRQPGDSDSLKGDRNAPAIWVSWDEALAFCAWLSERWAAHLPVGWHVSLPSEAEWEKAARGGLDLPTYAQLTTAMGLTAIGLITPTEQHMTVNPAPQRAYPWGDDWDAECANTADATTTGLTGEAAWIGRTSAVGAFPMGRSACGAEDLAGNVWEWTSSLWGTDFMAPGFAYPYPDSLPQREDLAAGSKTIRILRGGGWTAPRSAARCAFRYRYLADYRNLGFGFRLVLCCAPVK